MVTFGSLRFGFQNKGYCPKTPARSKSFSWSDVGLGKSGRDWAVRSNSLTAGNIVASPHPDAIRRRKEAEKRRLERAAALQTTVAATQGRAVKQAAPNLIDISDPSELMFRLESCSRNNELVVAHFKAAWCSACARMQYKVGQIAQQNPDVTFLVIDVSKSPELLAYSTSLGVEQLPYFLFYKNKECTSRFTCNLGKINRLREEIDRHKPRASVSLLEDHGDIRVKSLSH